MAIGLAKMFGFNLLENFNYPYAATSVTDFWRRWHISLSTWFKDYLYIPVGGNRKGQLRTAINLFIVFFATGAWHGADYHFVFWGLGHGLFLSIEKIFGKKIASLIKSKTLRYCLGHIYTLSVVTMLWGFFALFIWQGFDYIRALFSFNGGSENFKLYLLSSINAWFIVCFIAAVIFAFPWWKKIAFLSKHNFTVLRYLALLILLVLSICRLAQGAYNPFIYFRF
jgi:alginate O-acetyltransferase complex protein AlgI